MRQSDTAALDVALVELALAAGEVALYCDRAEHAEEADVALLRSCAERLLNLSVRTSQALRCDVFVLYATRLGAVERRAAVVPGGAFDGAAAAAAAETWRDLQHVQAAHDRDHHPDVMGLARLDQVRHCAFHVAKIVSWAARAREDDRDLPHVRDVRIPDALLFGLKLATLARVRLPSAALPREEPARLSLRGSRG